MPLVQLELRDLSCPKCSTSPLSPMSQKPGMPTHLCGSLLMYSNGLCKGSICRLASSIKSSIRFCANAVVSTLCEGVLLLFLDS